MGTDQEVIPDPDEGGVVIKIEVVLLTRLCVLLVARELGVPVDDDRLSLAAHHSELRLGQEISPRHSFLNLGLLHEENINPACFD